MDPTHRVQTSIEPAADLCPLKPPPSGMVPASLWEPFDMKYVEGEKTWYIGWRRDVVKRFSADEL